MIKWIVAHPKVKHGVKKSHDTAIPESKISSDNTLIKIIQSRN